MPHPALLTIILYIGMVLAPNIGHAEEPLIGAALEESGAESTEFTGPAENTGIRASNVLFLPGIKGSRLYDGAGAKLWEPFGDHDIEDLMLDSSGKSIRDDVHPEPEDIVDSVALFSDIYGSYMDFMDGLVEDGTINAWSPVAYDWRLSLPDIVNAGLNDTGPVPMSLSSYGLPPIQEVLENLAQDSQTGKVTIIAHSNGGLVAKQLMRSMGDSETSRLIDKVIFVGVPQSGAPQALGALLYGYREGLPSWFPGIVSTATAREFAENAPMGYHLLPSEPYFRDIEDEAHAIMRFDAEHGYVEERMAYGSTVEDVSELHSFAHADEGGREKPIEANVHAANILNETLLSYARDIHAEIDPWTPPASIDVYQIAGWGENTVAGIEYYERCVFSLCKEMYRPTFVEDGDGVVPVSSALMIPESERVRRFWFDLKKFNDESPFDKDHGNLLSAPEVRSHLLNLLIGNDDPSSAYITRETPVTSRDDEYVFFLHSPLTLELFDANGNRTGYDSDDIADAEYGEFGDVKYIYVRNESELEIKLRGYAEGTFTLEILKFSDGTLDEVVFNQIPSTPDTIATVQINPTHEHPGPLELDTDGDGNVDQKIDSFTESPAVTTATQVEHGSHSSSKSRTSISPTLEELMLILRALLERLLFELEQESSLRSGI